MDKNKTRMTAQEMKDLEKMRKKEKELYQEGAKTAGAMLAPMAKAVKDDSEPTEKEKEMMRQQVRERKMDEGTARGAAQYEGYAKGGVVTKGNGCAIRGVKKCKIC